MKTKHKDPKSAVNPKDQNDKPYPGKQGKPSAKSPDNSGENSGSREQKTSRSSSGNWEYPEESAHVSNEGKTTGSRKAGYEKPELSRGHDNPDDEEDEYFDNTGLNDLNDDDEEF